MFDLIRKLRQTEEEKREELIRAYIDQEMSHSQRQAFEQQMVQDSNLALEVQQQQALIHAMQQLPLHKAPRNFTVSYDMVGSTTITVPWYKQPVWRASTILAAIVIVALLVFTLSQEGIMQPQTLEVEHVVSSESEAASDVVAAVPAEVESQVTVEVVKEVVIEGIVTKVPAEPFVAGNNTNDGSNQDTATDMTDDTGPEIFGLTETGVPDTQTDENATNNAADTAAAPPVVDTQSYSTHEDDSTISQAIPTTRQPAPPRSQDVTPPNRTGEITATTIEDTDTTSNYSFGEINPLTPTTIPETELQPSPLRLPIAGIFIGLGTLFLLIAIWLKRPNKV